MSTVRNPVTTPVTPTPPQPVPDDVADLYSSTTVTPELNQKLQGKLVISKVLVKKPRAGQWVWVHPFILGDTNIDTAWCREIYLMEEASGMEKEYWVLANEVLPHLSSEIPKRRLLIAYAIKDGGVCLWPLAFPEGTANGYIETAWDAATNYNNRWIKLVSDKETASWKVWEFQLKTVDPRWPEKGFRHLFETAFKSRLLKDPNHQLLVAKMGRNAAV